MGRNISRVLILTLAASTFFFGVAAADVVERIVAIVGDEIITLGELDEAVKPYVPQIKEANYSPEKEKKVLFKMREDVLNNLIDGKLRDIEVERYEITVTEEEIDNNIERFKENRSATQEQLVAGLKEQGMTLEDFRETTKDRILMGRLINREVNSKIVIVEEDIKAYYDEHASKYAKVELYTMALLSVQRAAGTPEDANIAEQMEKVRAELNAGKSIPDAVDELKAAQYGAGVNRIGPMNYEDLADSIKEALKGLGEGDITPALGSGDRLQVFQIIKIDVTEGKELDEVRNEIDGVLYDKIVKE